MKFLRKPIVSAVILLFVTLFYSFVFIFISEHIEFAQMLDHSATLNSPFWNGLTVFLQNGNLKYIGYAYLLPAAAIVLLSLLKRRNYDEYQTKILETGLIFAGIVMMILFPVAMLLVLSDPNYAIETLIFLAAAHWGCVLLADLVYVLRH